MGSYHTKNHAKYNLKIHLIFATKYRRKTILGEMDKVIKQEIKNLAKLYNWNIMAIETDKNHIHMMLGYHPNERISDIVHILKQHTTYRVWQKYSEILNKCYWRKHVFWSRGYFACSVGDVSAETIKKYIESQS